MQQRICTKEEIEQLHLFCKKHFVKYADVREELVDHLASAIEEQWQADKNIRFKDALQNCYKQFGANGFRKIEEEKREALKKHYQKKKNQFLLSFFNVPQIFATILIAIALFFIIPENPQLFRWSIGVLGAIAFLCVATLILYINKRWKKLFNTNKILIIKTVYAHLTFNCMLIFCQLNLINFSNGEDTIGLWFRVLAVLSILCIITITIFCFLLSKQAEKEIIKKYPQLVK